MIIVAVGSTNPVKVNAVIETFATCFPSWKFTFVQTNAASGISDQPMTDEETRTGAINRAKDAAELCKKEKHLSPDFSVGLEGGCLEENFGEEKGQSSLTCFAWMAILKISSSTWGISRTASFSLPTAIQELVRGGMELGDADDVVFQRKNSKQQDGAVGILSHGLIDRKEYYKHALVLGLTRFRNEDLYF